MDEEFQTAALGVVATVVALCTAVFVLASKAVAVVLLGALTMCAGLALIRQYRILVKMENEVEHAYSIGKMAYENRSAPVAELRDGLREEEAKILEMIAADVDTDDVLASVTSMLARHHPETSFRITTDELFGAESVDFSYGCLLYTSDAADD